MINRRTKLRWRRLFRKRKRQVEDFGEQADKLAERHFFRRISRLVDVRRFVFAWVSVMILLSGIMIYQTVGLDGFYQHETPIPGGTFTEGIVGSFTNANPLYTTGSVNNAVSRLLFSGLLKSNEKNQLVGDLAEKWDVDSRGITYTVFLKNNLKWHDGRPLTAEDVVFTYQTIQKPDAKSPLINSWKGIKIEAKDPLTIVFTLPNALSSFPYALTNGIVPIHILNDIPLNQLRSTRFNNIDPVGSGPFKWDSIEVSGSNPENRQEKIGFVANENYHVGSPRLDRFVIRTFRDQKLLLDAFAQNDLDAIVGVDSIPEEYSKKTSNVFEYDITLTSQENVFFKTTSGVLADQKVRQALVRSVSVGELVKGLRYPAKASRGPLLDTHIGFDKAIVQLPTDIAAANKSLDEAGWAMSENGIRKKADQTLTFSLHAVSSPENVYITQTLQKMWRNVGVDVQVNLQSAADLQFITSSHGYDALLYAVAVGPDPDVYAYWHSTQALTSSPSRLNFSEYKSSVADKSLEAGRTRSDPSIRAVKYQPFLSAWTQDAPALTLFQPRFVYYSHDKIFGLDPVSMNTSIDRFANVENWMIRQVKTIR